MMRGDNGGNMRKYLSSITAITFALLLLTGCGNKSEKAAEPLLGLTWFAAYDDVLTEMSENKLIAERESADKVKQRMQDYEAMKLYGTDCDLTLCFTDSGLVGFNYHDIQRNQSYRQWFSEIEKEHGLPTEEGSGMASWYDDPLGKNTAIYLFNLEEGVQVSFYATADSPDKSYEKQKERFIPTPELRSPVIAAEDSTSAVVSATETTSSETTATEAAAKVTAVIQEYDDEEFEETYEEVPADVAITEIQPTQNTTVKNETATVKADRSNDFLINGLKFYGSADTERKKMSGFTQIDEYRTEEAGQPWETVMEYENIPYLGKKCDGVLCFTSLGLVGVNYFDPDTDDYSYWIDQLTDIYGQPDESQSDYSVWNEDTVGNGTTIYVFAFEDGIQISFFVDDTGSEIA